MNQIYIYKIYKHGDLKLYCEDVYGDLQFESNPFWISGNLSTAVDSLWFGLLMICLHYWKLYRVHLPMNSSGLSSPGGCSLWQLMSVSDAVRCVRLFFQSSWGAVSGLFKDEWGWNDFPQVGRRISRRAFLSNVLWDWYPASAAMKWPLINTNHAYLLLFILDNEHSYVLESLLSLFLLWQH